LGAARFPGFLADNDLLVRLYQSSLERVKGQLESHHLCQACGAKPFLRVFLEDHLPSHSVHQNGSVGTNLQRKPVAAFTQPAKEKNTE